MLHVHYIQIVNVIARSIDYRYDDTHRPKDQLPREHPRHSIGTSRCTAKHGSMREVEKVIPTPVVRAQI
jgi:hypothetical protein